MSPRVFVATIVRAWWVVVAMAALGAVGGWITARAPDRAGPTSFRATHTLLVTPDPTSFTPANPATVALLATIGEVPARAAAALGGDPTELNGQVEITGDPGRSLVTITVTNPDARRAEAVADTFATTLVDYLGEQEAAARAASLDALAAEVDDLRSRAEALGARIAGEADADRILRQEHEIVLSQFVETFEDYQHARTSPPARSSLVSIGAATSEPVADEPGPPRSQRAFLLAGAGLLIGAIGVAARQRLDDRIMTRAQASAAFGFDVIAEVPATGWMRRLRQPSAGAGPAISEAHRLLRNTLLIFPAEAAATTPALRDHARGQVVMVTSARPGEGKTATSANLAAALAEGGRSVLVLGADLRRPKLHRHYDAPASPGLAEVLAAGPASLRLADVVRPTSIPGVSVVASGVGGPNPGELMIHIDDVLEEARTLAAVVVVDSPPLLDVNDTIQLVQGVDAVVVVCRARRSTSRAARRSQELLARLQAPVAGLVFIGPAEAIASGYAGLGHPLRSHRRGSRRQPEGLLQ